MNTGKGGYFSLRADVAVNYKGLTLSPATGERLVSLRLKGYLAYAILTAFAIILALFIFYQKRVLLAQFDDLQRLYGSEISLHDAKAQVLNALETQQLNLQGIDMQMGAGHVREHLRQLSRVSRRTILPGLDNHADRQRFLDALEQAIRTPDTARLETLSQVLLNVRQKIEQRLRRSREQREQLARNFRERSDDVALISLLLGLFSLVLLGTIIGVFFSRLARDLILLRQRGQEIIQGQRGNPVPIERNDEVGDLAKAINKMADDLDQHERTLELERQKSFHREKMAAMGTLAAGIAHEVGNPIAAISALVRELIDEKLAGKYSCDESELHKLHMLLDNAQRLGSITREISGLVQPQSEEFELFDLNALIRGACNLMRYDRRWKNIQVNYELDKNLPAIRGISDQITQVVMNLLVNALDALDDCEQSERQITVATGTDDRYVWLCVEDNGQGMDEATLKKATQEFFTTKGQGKGTGLGLSLCNSIVETHHGRLEIHSRAGEGTRVCARLPLDESPDSGV